MHCTCNVGNISISDGEYLCLRLERRVPPADAVCLCRAAGVRLEWRVPPADAVCLCRAAGGAAGDSGRAPAPRAGHGGPADGRTHRARPLVSVQLHRIDRVYL